MLSMRGISASGGDGVGSSSCCCCTRRRNIATVHTRTHALLGTSSWPSCNRRRRRQNDIVILQRLLGGGSGGGHQSLILLQLHVVAFPFHVALVYYYLVIVIQSYVLTLVVRTTPPRTRTDRSRSQQEPRTGSRRPSFSPVRLPERPRAHIRRRHSNQQLQWASRRNNSSSSSSNSNNNNIVISIVARALSPLISSRAHRLIRVDRHVPSSATSQPSTSGQYLVVIFFSAGLVTLARRAPRTSNPEIPARPAIVQLQ